MPSDIESRTAKNHERFVGRLLDHLSRHRVQVYDKIDDVYYYPEPVGYYELMLDAYYLSTIDHEGLLFDTMEEHMLDLISFIEFSDEEFDMRLISGKTKIPLMISTNIKIPNTIYRKDYGPKKRY